MGEGGEHDDFLVITKSVNYSAGIYYFNMYLWNNGEGNIFIDKVVILFPPGVDYVNDSTSGNITTDNPAVSGDSDSGVILAWDISPNFKIKEGDTEGYFFQLSGEAGIEDVEGHSYVKATRQDVGTVWDSESQPYSITAEAKDAADSLVAVMKIGLWGGGFELDIECWQVNQ